MDSFKPKPLVDANLVTEFGGVEDMEQFKADGAAQRDYLYVPGFSEMRVERDRALVKLARNEIRAKEVPTLDCNLYWCRTIKGAGSDPDHSQAVAAKSAGYRPVTKDDVGKPWMLEIPPGGHIAPDGLIKVAGGDLALYVIDREGAARNAMRKKIATEASVDGIQFQSGGLGQVGKQHKGADPVVEKTIGTPVKGATE